MDNVVYYCCVAKGGKIIQAYSGGDLELENLAALCLKSAPPCHRWYTQSMGRKTYGFLMEDGFVYFAISDVGLGNPRLLRFLEHVRDEFKKITKKDKGLGQNVKGRPGSLFSQISSLGSGGVQEQLVPVICRLIKSLQNVSQTGEHDLASYSSPYSCETYGYGEFEPATSTKAPLLGKNICSTQEKSAMIGLEMEEHCRSADRRCRAESDSSNHEAAVAVTVSPTPLQKELSGSMRMRSASQTARRKWCRLVWLVLIIDVAVCIILFLVWLVICDGTRCVGLN